MGYKLISLSVRVVADRDRFHNDLTAPGDYAHETWDRDPAVFRNSARRCQQGRKISPGDRRRISRHQEAVALDDARRVRGPGKVQENVLDGH